jgi:hypothetical protein
LRKEGLTWKENRIQKSETKTTWRKGPGFYVDDFNSDVEENEDLDEDEKCLCGFCGVK